MTPPQPLPTSLRTRTRRWLVAGAVTSLAAAGLATAGSGAATVEPSAAAAAGVVTAGLTTDADDTSGRLDISRVAHRATEIDRHHVVMSYRVRSFTPFPTARLDPDKRNLVIELNRDAERGSERNVRISSQDGHLIAEVISNATREVIATVEATRPNDQTVRISGPRRLLGARSYFWTSNFHAAHSRLCGRGDGFPIVCQDSVPQRGWAHVDRPGWPQ